MPLIGRVHKHDRPWVSDDQLCAIGDIWECGGGCGAHFKCYSATRGKDGKWYYGWQVYTGKVEKTL
jgi:hypothetical protein